MAKFICKCENIIRTSGAIPNPNEWLIMSDVEYDSLDPKMNLDELNLKMKSFFICDRCGRLWFFWKGFDSDPIPYKIDE